MIDRDIEIRALESAGECAEAVALQKQIWGFDEIETIPARFFVVAHEIGGQVFGAYHGGRLVGFLLAVPALKEGRLCLHSHMLGVLEPYRNRGVGRMLKLRQREDALARGIRLIQWTFDPLELKNAYFNIERLGAIVRRYVLNQYGVTTSALHRGLPTDRCTAEWWLASDRVEAILSGRPFPRPPVLARITIPCLPEAADQKRLREIQKSVSEQFLNYLGKGLAVIGFECSERAGTYLLGEWTPDTGPPEGGPEG